MHRTIAFARGLMLLTGIATASPCAGPTGLYHDTIKKPDGTVFVDVTLNLVCNKDSYIAQIFTSMGDFKVTDTRGGGNEVKIAFDSGASLGSLTLASKGDDLAGQFAFGADKGPITFTRTGSPLAIDALEPRTDLAPAQWRGDIDFYARELPRLHANAFFHISRTAFEAEIEALKSRADTANGDEMLVGLQAVTKSIGDDHTTISVGDFDRRPMPIELAKFGDDLRIVAASADYRRLLGTRITRICGMPVAQVWSRGMTLTPAAELEQLRREDALAYLARGYALHGLDVIPNREHAIYTVEDDSGKMFDVDVTGSKTGEDATMIPAFPDTTLRMQHKDASFWCATPAPATVYCGWRGYEDLDAHAKDMFALIDRTKADRLVLDMRDNGGGDNTVGDAAIVKPLIARTDINRKGQLYVLIGAETFSAAMNNAAQLQDGTNAILAGEAIGEKPNSYQEPRQFRLPNSHFVVRASTLYYEFRKKGPNVVAPDKTIIPTYDDLKAGRDPVLDWVLAQKSG